MLKKIILAFAGLIIGLYLGYLLINNLILSKSSDVLIFNPVAKKNKIIGFLPYWLISKADKDYSKYINDFTYFGLTIDQDGRIKKLISPGETEPGWLVLKSGRIKPFLENADKNNLKKSLLVFSGNNEDIGKIIANPVDSANNMTKEVIPIMKQYGFTDLNLDIEKVGTASDSARADFTAFLAQVKRNLDRENAVTLTIDVSPIALFKKHLIDVDAIGAIADYLVLMTYDYHYQNSSVTGAVSPHEGAGKTEEFDVEVSVKEAIRHLNPEKIILGIPLYGYEWETIDRSENAAALPSSGIVASNRRVEKLVASCDNCLVSFDETKKESRVVFPDEKTGSYHQIYYPNKKSVEAKIRLAERYGLGGVAVWALGYEGNTILDPLQYYR